MPELEHVRTVTAKGQVTIPAEIRRHLDIKPEGRVVFAVEGGRVILYPAPETLESAFGAVEPLHRPEGWQELRDRAIQEHAQRVARKMDPTA